jgi:hypothetical protein
MIEFRPVNESDLRELHAAASRDNHGVLAPTHCILKNGEIVGYLSVGGIPLVNLWLDSQQVKARDTLEVMAKGEDMAREMGWEHYITPCDPKSPLYRFVSKLGYQVLGSATFLLKKLNQGCER